MNDFEKDYIKEYAEKLSFDTSVSYTEAERRAGDFLMVMAKITDIRHLFSQEKIKLLSIQTATYAQQMAKGTSKTVTENKLIAEASEEYTKAREDLEGIENDLSYLKTYYEIFLNGHLFYRQMAKGVNE